MTYGLYDYTALGALRVTVSDGQGYKGAYAPDGSLYVTYAPGSTYVGLRAPDGSLYVSQAGSGYGRHAPDGSTFVTTDATDRSGALFITSPVPAAFTTASVYIDFTQANTDGTYGKVWTTGQGSNVSSLFSRTGTGGLAFDSSGNLVSFTSTALRATNAGLTTEQSATNLQVHSDYNGWSTEASTLTATAATAPDGTLTASSLTDDTSSTRHDIFWVFGATIVAGSTITASTFMKQGTARYAALGFASSGNTDGFFVSVDLQTGTLSTPFVVGAGTAISSTITPYADGWYRVTLTGIVNLTSTGCFLAPCVSNALVTDFDSLNYTGTGQTFYLWGAQVETGLFATTPIVTAGSTVTRAQDGLTATLTGLLSSPTSATLFIEATPEGLPGTDQTYFQIDDGTTSNLLALYTQGSDETNFGLSTVAGTNTYNLGVGTSVAGAQQRLALSATSGAYLFSSNGSSGTAGSSVSLPTGLTTIRLGSGVSSATPFSGIIKRLAIFDTALTQSQLNALV